MFIPKQNNPYKDRVYYIFDFKKELVISGNLEIVLQFLNLEPSSFRKYVNKSCRASALYYVKTVNDPNYFKDKTAITV